MYTTFFIAIIAVFSVLLFLNIYFRVKVFKVYKYLVQNRIEFSVSHFLNDQKMREEVFSRYPEHEEQILKFVNLIRRSVWLASLLLAIILIFGYILLKFR